MKIKKGTADLQKRKTRTETKYVSALTTGGQSKVIPVLSGRCSTRFITLPVISGIKKNKYGFAVNKYI